MVGKLSIKAQHAIAFFDEVRVKMDRLYALVEQYTGARANEDQFMGPIGRTATDVNHMLMNAGYGVMADTANQIVMLAKRGGSKSTKSRGLREMVNSIRAAMETSINVIIAEEAHAEEAHKEDEEAD